MYFIYKILIIKMSDVEWKIALYNDIFVGRINYYFCNKFKSKI